MELFEQQYFTEQYIILTRTEKCTFLNNEHFRRFFGPKSFILRFRVKLYEN